MFTLGPIVLFASTVFVFFRSQYIAHIVMLSLVCDSQLLLPRGCVCKGRSIGGIGWAETFEDSSVHVSRAHAPYPVKHQHLCLRAHIFNKKARAFNLYSLDLSLLALALNPTLLNSVLHVCVVLFHGLSSPYMHVHLCTYTHTLHAPLQ